MSRVVTTKAAKRRDLERRARNCKVSKSTVREAAALIDRWEWTPEIEARLTAGVGRPRFLPWRPFLVLLVTHALRTQGTMVLTEVHLTAVAMSDKQRAIAGLPPFVAYHHVEGNFSDWKRAFEENVNRTTGELSPARFPYTVDTVVSDLLHATAPRFLPASPSVAADGTAIESPYRRRSSTRDGTPDVVAGQLPTDSRESAPLVRTAGWPRTGPDGRKQHTVDPDAREGYRSRKPGSTSIYIGYEPTTVCDVPAVKDPPRYALIRAITFRPAGSDRSEAGLSAVDALQDKPKEVIVDRGYNYTTTFGPGLVARDIGMVGDLHQNQRTTKPGPIPGTVIIDGDLFSDAVPASTRSLGAFGRGWAQPERLSLAARYDKRAAWAYTPMGRPDPTTGKLRFRGPAISGRVRCRNNPKSMRLKSTPKRPTTTCRSGTPCGCSRTVTLLPNNYARTFQTEIYGTTAWLSSYGRRVAIESSNGELRSNRVKITKFSFLVRGLTGTALLFGILCAAANILGLSDWYSEHWLTLIEMETEPPKFQRKKPGQKATHRLPITRSDH